MNFVDNNSDIDTVNYLCKSVGLETVQKAIGRDGLVPKKTVDKNGKLTTVFVRPIEEHQTNTIPKNKPEKRKQIPATPIKLTENTKHLVPISQLEEVPEHINKLKIPPTYRNVMVSPDPNAAILAIGKDDMDRPHYIYNPEVTKENSEEKFERVTELMGKKEELLIFIQGIKDKDTSDCLQLIYHMGIRPGSTRDTKAKVEAIGATTLRGEHVVTEGDKVFLRFIGKKGVQQNHEVTNENLKDMLLKRKESAGEKGDLFNTTDAKLRKTVKVFGDIKVKDLRTLLATSTAQKILQGVKPAETMKEFVKTRNKVGDTVSEVLGNQRSMALSSYINPAVFEKWSPDMYKQWSAKHNNQSEEVEQHD